MTLSTLQQITTLVFQASTLSLPKYEQPRANEETDNYRLAFLAFTVRCPSASQLKAKGQIRPSSRGFLLHFCKTSG